jgi:cytochrome c-type biogenesis protein CcmE
MAQTDVAMPDVQVSRGFLAGKGKFIIGGLLIVGAILVLAVRSFQSSAVYYLTLEELQAKGPSMVDQDVRLAALLDKSSIVRDNTNLILKFNVTENNVSLPIIYSFAKNPVPDTFELGESVVAEGRLRADGVFEAHQLFVQCPSKYEAQVKETK